MVYEDRNEINFM